MQTYLCKSDGCVAVMEEANEGVAEVAADDEDDVEEVENTAF